MHEEDVTTKTISYDKFEAKMLQMLSDGVYEPDRCPRACVHSYVKLVCGPVSMVWCKEVSTLKGTITTQTCRF